MLLRLALAAALALTLTACDAAGPALSHGADPYDAGAVAEEAAPPTPVVPFALRVPVLGATAGDFLYSLAPVPLGATFSARLETSGGTSLTLRSTGDADGVAVDLALAGLSPDSVTVAYLAGGVPVAGPVTYAAAPAAPTGRSSGDPDPYSAGTADRDPDSYHWEERDGQIVLVKDYKDGSSRRAGGSGTGFVTATGERVRVTDVVFTVHGAAAGAPGAVVFESPSAFVLDWFGLDD